MKSTLKIETVAIESLLPDPSNARKHDRKNLDAIKGSLAKFGQRKPVVVRNNVVIAGNGTLQAAKELGLTKLAIVRADDMSATEATAFALADNRTAELALWDDEVLKETVKSLAADGFEVSDIGFEMEDFLDSLPDYSILGADAEGDLDGFESGVRKALQIEFTLEDYPEAFDLVKFWRENGGDVGKMLIAHLREKKVQFEASQG